MKFLVNRGYLGFSAECFENGKLKSDKIKEYISRDMKIGMNLPIRLAPLFVKKLFIRFN